GRSRRSWRVRCAPPAIGKGGTARDLLHRQPLARDRPRSQPVTDDRRPLARDLHHRPPPNLRKEVGRCPIKPREFGRRKPPDKRATRRKIRRFPHGIRFAQTARMTEIENKAKPSVSGRSDGKRAKRPTSRRSLKPAAAPPPSRPRRRVIAVTSGK